MGRGSNWAMGYYGPNARRSTATAAAATTTAAATSGAASTKEDGGSGPATDFEDKEGKAPKAKKERGGKAAKRKNELLEETMELIRNETERLVLWCFFVVEKGRVHVCIEETEAAQQQ